MFWLSALLSFTLKTEVIRSTTMAVHIPTTQHYIPGDGNIHNYCCKDLKSYINSTS
jgi:hypothetical protein